MLIGTLQLEPEDTSKSKEITEKIGYNPSRKNIVINQNFNMNIMPEKIKDDVDKLTYQYLQLAGSSKEDNKGQFSEISPNRTKYPKLMYTDNNFYTGLLYPEPPKDNFNRTNNIEYDGGTFLTDKITFSARKLKKNDLLKEKDNINKNRNDEDNNENNNINNLTTQKESKGEIYSTGFESIPELKHSVPVSFDKLIVNLSDEPGKPKPINPLFFVINGEKPIDKKKFINFRTNPSLYTALNRKISHSTANLDEKKNFSKTKKTEQDIEKSIIKKNLTDNIFNITSKTPKFLSSFNKAAENKAKLTYDLKKTIFNDPFTHMEDKYKILKDLQRNELMNRALGRGIFSCNKYYDDEKRALAIQKRKKFEQFLEDSKEKMAINLRTKIDFFDDKKKSYPDSQSIITHDYLKLVKEDYKKTEGYKQIEKYKSELMKKKVENLCRPKSRKKTNKEIMTDTKMDKLLKNARFEYSKPYAYLASDLFFGKS